MRCKFGEAPCCFAPSAVTGIRDRHLAAVNLAPGQWNPCLSLWLQSRLCRLVGAVAIPRVLGRLVLCRWKDLGWQISLPACRITFEYSTIFCNPLPCIFLARYCSLLMHNAKCTHEGCWVFVERVGDRVVDRDSGWADPRITIGSFFREPQVDNIAGTGITPA
jgi:hypothetical protein